MIATTNGLIRITEQCDGWRVHSKKGNVSCKVKACFILPDDKVLVALWSYIQFYTSSLDHLNEVELNTIVDGLSSVE